MLLVFGVFEGGFFFFFKDHLGVKMWNSATATGALGFIYGHIKLFENKEEKKKKKPTITSFCAKS